MYDPKAAIALIEQHGVYGLSGYDGCRCAWFMVFAISVEVHCHKSSPSSTIEVSTRYAVGAGAIEEMREVGEAVRKSLGEGAEAYEVRACHQAGPPPEPPMECLKAKQDLSGPPFSAISRPLTPKDNP